MTVFGDAEFVREIKSKFVSVAVNQHHHRRRKDVEYVLFEKLVRQTGEKVSGYNQGLYFFTPSAELLSYSNTVRGDAAWKLLKRALDAHEPKDGLPKILEGHESAGPLWSLPKGSQAVLVTSRVLGGYEPPDDRFRRIHQQSLARDHLWIAKEEIAALAGGRMPDELKQRISPLLNDNTRGEPGRWRKSEVKSFEITLDEGRLTGKVHFESAAGDRGYKAEILGFVLVENGRLARFDVVVKGDYWGEGRYTRNAPKGEFPFAVAFRLSDGIAPYDLPPPGS